MQQRISEIDQQIEAAERELAGLDKKRAAILEQMEALRREKSGISQGSPVSFLVNGRTPVTNQSPQEDKISLFRSLFRGREDVYPKRFESKKTGTSGYQPVCRNEWVKGICGKPRIRCGNCQNRKVLPVTDDVIRNHLLGYDLQKKTRPDFAVGVYPLLPDETCWFIAADFDQSTWMQDVSRFLEICKSFRIPAAVERSRSGNGGHVWVFFSELVPATLARKMISFVLTETMELRPEIGLQSYDRFFPNQDTLPKGGFGNLIALPLQKKPREKGNSLFLDDRFEPYPDQWAFLSSIQHMSLNEVGAVVDEAIRRGRVLGVRMSVTDEQDDEPWTMPPSGRRKQTPITGPLPKEIELILDNQIYVAKEGLPAPLMNRLIRLAAFQNPEFYKAQAMRFPTYDKPRIISCCEEFAKHMGLPRGCLDELIELLDFLRIRPKIVDKRFQGNLIHLCFHGTLRPEQRSAAEAILSHDTGVLSASTAFGKTVVAAHIIAERAVNTLVLVHRKHLLDMWVDRLSQFLGLNPEQIGRIGGGKRNPSGLIDIGIIQSLSTKGVVDDIVGQYGHLVVDECHRIAARSFEIVARQSKARYVTGLSATVARKDGHHPIIFMQCGPVRYRVDDRKQAAKRPFDHKVVVRKTGFNLPRSISNKTDPTINELYDALIADEGRNNMIINDVLSAVDEKRSPVLLTERKKHLDLLAARLTPIVRNVIVLKGGMGEKQRRSISAELAHIPDEEERVIVATGRYLGEGFDDARLDTLFLALPVSWRGIVSQYAGRLHRIHKAKKEVVIFDYADTGVPMLAKMYERRCAGYTNIGYEIHE
ncbi:MAG: DEAD/DEAH box helicase family protein [Desulfobacteraceae bacterium]|nr:DEAD/DEAH box helicase family protein [Desulfobacterales bacterium]MBL6968439.1 DEAD/DEAH box helicase family protein [Desulfobacteraceae bacterium]